ncbi:hypothetical protein GCM10010193_02520 [Kitasatospora atroaurantiaca]|uniref:Excreted virulence factor EspC (Type VII ESX diderm) n=1 Tax=Kitasatospora atroaurantiaca TaxID=285545 RepID=A0A561ELH5_9ACTN|nr:hypothetical protein [Kitasatospora atroaurantiaca]TWE16473.1 hypothetical protein FB465_1455 [Kitasatospora atroaurantiaca]
MSGEYRVDPEALRRFARTSAERSDKLRAIRSELGSHMLAPDAFGKLPESAEIGRHYQERAEAALDNLTSAADTMERINTHSEDLARSYERAEQETADSMRTMMGGLGA